ncbi:MAG: methyl-accepting chemotaxis protein [Gammaproteobacteria bacterium SHHR-1]|uniref:methyl-accepting chemotaxis protein n=1 Tax=Magnetovirga frankeli TaxID=947516 RepID=UPI001AF79B4F|nr:methyl-accepting chemotaxis protein [gamma proteobacterium SS-5]
MKEKSLSIQTKFLAAFTVGFLTILGASTFLTMEKEKQLIDQLLEDMLHNTARSYFDGINTMMLTGTMAQRDVLRDKVLKQPNILDARIIRNQAHDPLLKATEAREHELPLDELDRRALAGEQISLTGRNEAGRTLSVLVPLKAVEDYSGTNCLTCHQVPKNSVLGAVRIDMSLAGTDAEIHAGLLGNLLVNAALFLIGLGLFAWLFRHLIRRRMQRLEQSMTHIAEQADLCTRIEVVANDEIGRVSMAFNHMVERFHHSLQEVTKTSHQLNQSADEITQVVEQTANAVLEQQNETDSVATAINQLSATANQVRDNAQRAAEVSITADNEAAQGTKITTEVIQGIDQLMAEISRAAAVIEQLASRSTDVGGVLDVIKSIAEQTNLLALNAAIEAARAGEMGRGFAVVADEVRNLANRSHQSTQEIESMIAQLQQGAQEAVTAMQTARQSAQERSEQVQQAVNNLNTISGIVGDIRQLNTQMDHAAQEQFSVTESISYNITHIAQLADNTAEDASRTSRVSEELARLSHQLNNLIEQFKLCD